MEKYQLTQSLQKQSNTSSTDNSSDLLQMKIKQQLLICEASGATTAARAILYCMTASDTFEYNDAILDAYMEALLVASSLKRQAEELSKQMEVL
ncbi:MAG: hypothetical protein ABJK37_05470 [Paraglaciecola sp.]|uniref:hypothetical protein n=1 Tax=Paraglaciecola sp. TaxID=1920173 RepID=UPI0032975AA2